MLSKPKNDTKLLYLHDILTGLELTTYCDFEYVIEDKDVVIMNYFANLTYKNPNYPKLFLIPLPNVEDNDNMIQTKKRLFESQYMCKEYLR